MCVNNYDRGKIMRFRDIATEMTEQEILTALYIVLPDSKFKHYKRKADFIRVWYSLPNDLYKTEHKLDLLPDNIYFVDDNNEFNETPVCNGDVLYQYCQLTVARGYSTLWKGNPYIL